MTLGLDSARDAILQTPKSEPNRNFRCWFAFMVRHGAGQSADEMFDYLGTAPEAAGMIVEVWA